MSEKYSCGDYCKPYHSEEQYKYGESHHECCHGEKCNFSEKLLKLADEAWMEVLKEKIKIGIENKHGEHLEKLAEIVGNTNSAKWKHKIKSKAKCEEYKNTLKDFFASKYED